MDVVPEDDPKFQDLLEGGEEVTLYPDISAELPGVELEEKERECQTVPDKPEPDFCELAAAALHNTGIIADDSVRAAGALGATDMERGDAALAEADKDEIVYKITFDVPDAGRPLPNAELLVPLEDNRDNS
jgi:hypothetical protein